MELPFTPYGYDRPAGGMDYRNGHGELRGAVIPVDGKWEVNLPNDNGDLVKVTDKPNRDEAEMTLFLLWAHGN
jgi:hypothetical protein